MVKFSFAYFWRSHTQYTHIDLDCSLKLSNKPFPFPYTEDFEGKFISTNDKNKIHPDWPSTCAALLGKNRKFWKYKVVYVYAYFWRSHTQYTHIDLDRSLKLSINDKIMIKWNGTNL
jgi:hypothetical protein